MRWRLSLTILLSAILTLLVSPIVNAKPASGAEIFYSTASVEKCTCKILMRRGKTEFSTMHTSGSFVARYYDPRTSVWQSHDPILSQYMDGEPNGGVLNSRNLNLYAYSWQNPVNLIDPNGLETVGIVAFKEGSTDKGAFEGRNAGMNLDQTYSVNTGKQFIQALIEASKSEPIDMLVVGSHGSGSALYMNSDEGLYGDILDAFGNSFFAGDGLPKAGAATLSDIKAGIDSRNIRFADKAKIFLLGCNTSIHPIPFKDSIAENFSDVIPNARVIGSTDISNPSHIIRGGRTVDSNDYYSGGRGSTTGKWHEYSNGSLIDTHGNPVNPTTFK